MLLVTLFEGRDREFEPFLPPVRPSLSSSLRRKITPSGPGVGERREGPMSQQYAAV
jgi:hypothetical protein